MYLVVTYLLKTLFADRPRPKNFQSALPRNCNIVIFLLLPLSPKYTVLSIYK